jgi:anti-anti-sigma factor
VSKVQTETKAKVDEVPGPKGPVTVLRFTGDISSTSRDTVLGTYEGVTKTRPVLIDFSKVEYINSSGIALVIQILMEANKADQRIAAFGLTPHFQKVFTMVGITKYAGLHRDEASAIASL